MSQNKIAILTGSKGRGSNMAAIIRATQEPNFPAQVALVVTPTENTPAAETAKTLSTSTLTISPQGPNYSKTLLQTLYDHQITLVCLAGFMTLLPLEIIQAFPDRILNIHPALLPSFGGKGMYGIHVHRAVLAAGAETTGCTVHFVSERYDEGAILHQRTCPVLPDDTPETLAARVLEQEHIAYPEAIYNLLTSQ
jgi:phosphoribosylglycinamide formyltransferase 1